MATSRKKPHQKGSRPSEAVAWPDFIRVRDELRSAGKWQELLCWVIGGYTAFRVSDFCSLKWESLLGRESLDIKEAKKLHLSQAARKVAIVDKELKEIIEECRAHLNPQSRPDFYLFRPVHGKKGVIPAMTRSSINRMLTRVAAEHNLNQQVSPHSLRKCCGLRAWTILGGNDAALQYVAMMYNHKSPDMTRRYLGITGRVISTVYASLSSGLPVPKPGFSHIESLYTQFNGV